MERYFLEYGYVVGFGGEEPSSNNNKEFLSPTIAIAIYIDEANPKPQNWEKEE